MQLQLDYGLLIFSNPIGLGIGGLALGAGAGVVAGGTIADDALPDAFDLPLYRISPQEIFSGLIPVLDVDFINPSNESTAVIGEQVSKWYVALRNLVLVGLMVVLLYIGIRIVISSTAGEKAKYKEHIKDWIVAVILVVFMHYIMAFALTITGYITNILNVNNSMIRYELTEEQMKAYGEASGDDYTQYRADDGKYYFYVDLMGYARLEQQLSTRDANGNSQFTWTYIGYTIIYLVLVIYTVMFIIIYLKRVVYMAFLTVIAPLVALTYPIDKISDGQAQAFNMWLKEYVYNLLIQPFHLLLYTLLVGSAMDLAKDNMIYAIVAIGFLMPAEKLLRRFFGFDQKAPEAGSIVGGVVGGSLAMSAIRNIGKIGQVSKRGNGGKASALGDGEEKGKTRLTERKPDNDAQSTDELIDAAFGGNNNSDSSLTNNQQTNLRLSPTQVNGDGNESEDLPAGYIRTSSGIIAPNNEPLQIQRPENTETREQNSEQIQRPENSGTREQNSEQIRMVPRSTNAQTQSQDNPNIVARIRNRGKRTLKAHPIAATGLKYTGKAITAVGRKIPRLATKTALGAAVGVAGVAAGVASGDWSNIVSYGAAAASVGASAGNGVSNIAGNIGSAGKDTFNDMRSDYMRRRYTRDEIKEINNEKADKEWEKSESTINLYRDKFGMDGYEEAMKKAKEYRKQGITDDKAIIAAQKLEGLDDDGAEKPSAERLLYARASSMIKTEDDLKAFGDRMRERNVEDKKIRTFNENIRKMNEM